MENSFLQFFDALSAPQRSLLVVNRTQPDPLVRILEGTFEGQPVSVSEVDVPDADDDTVLLVEQTGTKPISGSSPPRRCPNSKRQSCS